MTSKIITIIVVAILVLSLAACGAPAADVVPESPPPVVEPTPPPSESQPPPEPPLEPPQIEDIMVYPKTLQDMAGREIVIEAPVERLVSGFYISTSTIIALQAADMLVGIEARAADRPIYALARPDLLNLPDVGTARDFNLEACLALEPDLVILPIRLRETADVLDEMGIPVLLVNPESEEKLHQMIMLIAIATESKDRGEELINYLQGEKKKINDIVDGISEKPTVYISGVSSYLSAVGNEMYQAVLIEFAGGINAAYEIEGDSRQDISYEQLLAMNPEVFIIPPEASFDITEVTENPELKELEAVKTGRVYQMPSAFEAWDSPIPSSILGIKWLLSVLHEDVYPIDEMRQAAFAFYKEFYDIEIDVNQIEIR